MLYCWWLRSAVCKCHTPTNMRLQSSDIGHETSDNGQWAMGMKSNRRQNVRLVFSCCRFRCLFLSFFVILQCDRVGKFLLRTRQITVAVSVDDRSLQERLFEFTGCWGRPVIDIPQEMLELYLEHHFTPVKIAHLFSVSTKAIRKRLEKA